MPELSAGLLLYRLSPEGGVEVLLVHPGGPFWARKDDGAWSVPKGEYVEGEDAHAVAERELCEELGRPAPPGDEVALGEIRQKGGKRVTTWARRADLDVTSIKSNTFEMEWPPRSGQRQTFAEVDRAAWFGLAEAEVKILASQVPILDALRAFLASPPDVDT